MGPVLHATTHVLHAQRFRALVASPVLLIERCRLEAVFVLRVFMTMERLPVSHALPVASTALTD